MNDMDETVLTLRRLIQQLKSSAEVTDAELARYGAIRLAAVRLVREYFLMADRTPFEPLRANIEALHMTLLSSDTLRL